MHIYMYDRERGGKVHTKPEILFIGKFPTASLAVALPSPQPAMPGSRSLATQHLPDVSQLLLATLPQAQNNLFLTPGRIAGYTTIYSETSGAPL